MIVVWTTGQELQSLMQKARRNDLRLEVMATTVPLEMGCRLVQGICRRDWYGYYVNEESPELGYVVGLAVINRGFSPMGFPGFGPQFPGMSQLQLQGTVDDDDKDDDDEEETVNNFHTSVAGSSKSALNKSRSIAQA